MLTVPILPRPLTMTFMRWADRAGVESYDREVVWVREIRARNVRHASGEQVRPLSAFAAGRDFMEAVSSATEVAAMTARSHAAFRSVEIGVMGEAWDVPCLYVDGVAQHIPGDWYVQEQAAHEAWLLALAQGRRTLHPAVRLRPRIAVAGEVWNSSRTTAENQNALEEFTAVAAGRRFDHAICGRTSLAMH